MVPQNHGDLRADALDRVQRRHRILRDQRDAAAEQASPLAFRHAQEIAPLELDRSALDVGVGRKQSENGPPQHRFARTGLADQAPHLAGLDLQADAAQHVRRRRTLADRDMQVLHRENCGHWRCTGSSAALNPSPKRLNPTTLTMTHPMASAMIHGDW